jgi:hypothetical protein
VGCRTSSVTFTLPGSLPSRLVGVVMLVVMGIMDTMLRGMWEEVVINWSTKLRGKLDASSVLSRNLVLFIVSSEETQFLNLLPE